MPKNILIVDDDTRAVERRKLVLERAGYKVTGCYDGQEALDNLKKEKFDLVLLDLEMPKMSGNEVLRIMRQTPELREIKVLVITALTGSIQDRAREIGLTHRGWAGRFGLVEKWSRDGVPTVYPGYRIDRLSDNALLEQVERMFRFYEEIDRPKEPGEPDRILIADVQKEVVERIERILKERGYPVVYTADGEEALKILGEEDIDLVLLELDLPKLKGEELLKFMSRNFVLSNIPVVIFTKMRGLDKDKFSPHIIFEKPRRRWFFPAKDNTYEVIKAIEELLKERREMGFGYKKEKMSFVRNKKGNYLLGCLEAYQPVPLSTAQELGEMYLSQEFYCFYCEEYRHVDLVSCSCELPSVPRIGKTWQFSFYGDTAYLCFDCSLELIKKEPNFAKWWQKRSGESVLETLKRNREYIILSREERVKNIPEKVILSIKDFLLETGRIKSKMDIEITPTSRFAEDLDIDLSDVVNLKLWLDLKDKFRIEIPADLEDRKEEMKVYSSLKTVRDLIDYIEKKIGEQKV